MNTTGQELRGLRCVECGGQLQATRDPQLHRCRHCERLQMQGDDAGVEAFAPAGRLGRRRCAAALRELLHARGVQGHSVRGLQLRWLPFWQIEGRVVGWMRYRVQRVAREGEQFPQSGLVELKEESFARPLQLSIPACDMRGLGLLGLAYRLEGMRVRPLSLAALGPDEEACAVSMPVMSALRRARETAASSLLPQGAQRPLLRHSLLRTRTCLIYYPIWIAHYQVRGRSFEVVLDGLNGRALAGAAPRRVHDRSARWLAVAAAGGFLAGFHLALGLFAQSAWLFWNAREQSERVRRIGLGAWLSSELAGATLRAETIRDGGAGG